MLGAFKLNGISKYMAPTNQGWVIELTSTGTLDGAYGPRIHVDSSENLYIAGSTWNSGGTSETGYIAKLTSSASITWQKVITNTTFNCFANGISVDSSGNVFASGTYYTNATPNYSQYIVKYNSAGTQQWKKYQNGTIASTTRSGYDLTVSSAGDPIYVGSYGTAPYRPLLGKITSSTGAGSFFKRITNGTNGEYYNITIDSSGNIIVTGYISFNGSSNDTIIVKYTSAGAISWQRYLNTNSPMGQTTGVSTDNSNNIYFTGYGSSGAYVSKYDSTGTLQWSKVITPTQYTFALHDIVSDSSGNTYAIGYTGYGGGVIVKLDTNGSLIWSRWLNGVNAGFRSVKLVNNYLYIGGFGSTSSKLSITKVPTDGTATGTYGSYTYASLSVTVSNSGFTGGTTTYTDTTLTNTTTDAAFTESSGSQTASKTDAF